MSSQKHSKLQNNQIKTKPNRKSNSQKQHASLAPSHHYLSCTHSLWDNIAMHLLKSASEHTTLRWSSAASSFLLLVFGLSVMQQLATAQLDWDDEDDDFGEFYKSLFNKLIICDRPELFFFSHFGVCEILKTEIYPSHFIS